MLARKAEEVKSMVEEEEEWEEEER